MGKETAEALSAMILSASGWRGIFAKDGGEESTFPEISGAHKIIAAGAAKVFADYLFAAAPGKDAVIVGTDTRPTGKAIADGIIRALLAENRAVIYTGVTAAPEIMAFARSGGAAGFIYVSASHNPVGHNGIKFGLNDGGVLRAGETARLVSAFREFMASPECIEKIGRLLDGTNADQIARVYAAEKDNKKSALAAYRCFTGEVISGSGEKTKRDNFFAALKRGLADRPLGVAVDFNGSARTVSIDREFFHDLGAGFHSLNDKPGEIAHSIVPEGASLDTCRDFLEELHRNDPSVVLGYMPDCDGDRGNLVIWDETAGRARSLEAQEVFALVCVAELGALVWAGELKYDKNGKALTKVALAVNDPTSLRIDRVAGAFGVSVFRAEVGEANVVELAGKLRKAGYLTRFLGEGSAGGVIIHPSAVRDPVDTMGAALKILSIRSDTRSDATPKKGEELSGKGLFEIWCALSKRPEMYREDFTLSDIIASLPVFTTTGAYSRDAVLEVKTKDHGVLKDRYQRIFLREWETRKEALFKDYGFSGWKAIAYNGTEERRDITRFGEAGQGGLKIEFFREPGSRAAACLWMRGSGTEPVFRVMADVEGADRRLEQNLVLWQRQMVLEADNT